MSSDNTRASYKEAGESARYAIDRAFAEGAPINALRVLLAIVSHLTTWSRVEDKVSTAHLETLTHVGKTQVQLGLKWLREHEIIGWKSGFSISGGPRTASTVWLPAPPQSQRPDPLTGSGRATGPNPKSNADRTRKRATTEPGHRVTSENPSRILRDAQPSAGASSAVASERTASASGTANWIEAFSYAAQTHLPDDVAADLLARLRFLVTTQARDVAHVVSHWTANATGVSTPGEALFRYDFTPRYYWRHGILADLLMEFQFGMEPSEIRALGKQERRQGFPSVPGLQDLLTTMAASYVEHVDLHPDAALTVDRLELLAA